MNIDYSGDGLKSKVLDNNFYLDHLLEGIDLNYDQRKVIVAPGNILVLAGPGSGKTTTLIGKIKYLIDKKEALPSEIVILSFTNSVVNHISDRLLELELRENCLGKYAVRRLTIHSFARSLFPLIFENKTLYRDIDKSKFVQQWLFDKIDREMCKKLLLYFPDYFLKIRLGISPDDFLNHFVNKKQDVNYSNMTQAIVDNWTSELKNQMRTIKGENCHSKQEIDIANFLFRNGISYYYENVYIPNKVDQSEIDHAKRIKGSQQEYRPDFRIEQSQNGKKRVIYLEHFGVSESLKHDTWSQKEIDKYCAEISDKREHHIKYGTILINTWSSYNNTGKTVIGDLEDLLKTHGIKFKERKLIDIANKIDETKAKDVLWKFKKLLITFITHFKKCGYDVNSFNDFRSSVGTDQRSLFFISLVEELITAYKYELESEKKYDFEDFFNFPIEEFQNNFNGGSQVSMLPKYIIIDEFQDVTERQFKLVELLFKHINTRECCIGNDSWSNNPPKHEVPSTNIITNAILSNTNLIVVGDDHQSIFGFAGSNISLFGKFRELVKNNYYELMLHYNYRNSQQLIDIALKFIQKNPSQTKKEMISMSDTRTDLSSLEIRRVFISKYENDCPSVVSGIIKSIVRENGNNQLNLKILIVGRYNHDIDNIIKSKPDLFKYYRDIRSKMYHKDRICCHEFPDLQIYFKTIHRAKGLEFDYVILLNALEDDKYGFPSKIEDDPIMKLVVSKDDSFSFSEERRLFFVALTRARRRVFILASYEYPSTFVKEIISDNDLSSPSFKN